LNTTTAFYFVAECSNIAVFVRSQCALHCSVWGCACHNAFVLYLALTSLGSSVLLCSSIVLREQIVLRMRL